MLRLAHLSDVHVFAAPVWLRASTYAPKRLLGLANMLLRRGPNVHSADLMRRALDDVVAQGIKHVAISGDLTNVATEEEYAAVERILAPFRGQLRFSIVPGNHDIYTRACPQRDLFGKYMGQYAQTDVPVGDARFPYVHVLGQTVLFGVNSARPQPLFVAAGEVDAAQLARLEGALALPRFKNAFKIVMLHHPPIVRQSPSEFARNGTRHLDALRATLQRGGVDLVVHGHIHRPFTGLLAPQGPRVIVAEAGSSTYMPSDRHPERAARYNIYELADASGAAKPVLQRIVARVWQPRDHVFASHAVPLP